MSSIFLPIALPLAFACATGILSDSRLRKAVALAGFTLHLALAAFLLWICRDGAIETVVAGNWLPPFGIVLVVDLFSTIFLFAISLVFLATFLYQLGESRTHEPHILITPLVFILQSAVSLSLLTGDFFNLFVSFEMMLVTSYALICLGLSEQYYKYALSYLLLNLIASMGFLCAAAMIYGHTGHLNLAVLADLLKDQSGNSLINGWAYILLGVFGLKAGIFPMIFLVPKTYSHLPSALGALFAGTLTKVGIYVLLRMFVVVIPGPLPGLTYALYGISILTMLLGVFGAISSKTIRGIFSYHITSQIGYMILGLSLYTPLAIASSILFIVHNIWVKVCLYLVGGVAKETCESDTLKNMGNLSTMMPWLATFFLVQALSLAGFPPLSGFWGKYLLVLESIRLEHYLLAVVGLLTSWFTLYSMLKIWKGAFWQSSVNDARFVIPQKLGRQYAAIVLLLAPSLLLGLGAEPAYEKASLAARQLFEKESYIKAVAATAGKGVRR